MMHSQTWSWALLFLLGAYHGINPAMGWLFAVALGLQRQSATAVWQALVPIALGHIVAIASVMAIAMVAGLVFPILYLKIVVGLLLAGFGIYRIAGKGHARWGGMQVNFRDLTVWSFLMASAHGAGLMLLPIVLGMTSSQAPHDMHSVSAATGVSSQVFALAVHTCGYLLVTGVVAWIVYTKLGLSLLRRSWFNLDLLWAVALIVTAGLTFASV